MTVFLTLLFFGSVGLIFWARKNPEKAVFWSKDKNKKIATLGYCAFAFMFIVLIGITAPSEKSASGPVDESKYLKGIQAVDVYLNLEKKGFSQKHDSVDVKDLPHAEIWSCKKESGMITLDAEVFGQSYDKITSIRATVQSVDASATDSTAKDYLGYIATVQIEGIDHAAVRQWVSDNIGSSTSKVFGKVKYEIIASTPNVRMLKISPAI